LDGSADSSADGSARIMITTGGQDKTSAGIFTLMVWLKQNNVVAIMGTN
jgi:hypothetical protein